MVAFANQYPPYLADASPPFLTEWEVIFQCWYTAVAVLVDDYFNSVLPQGPSLTIEQLPDQPYVDWFVDGCSPQKAAKLVIQALAKS